MKFTAGKKQLLAAIRAAAVACEPKSPLPAFRMIHLSVRETVTVHGHSDPMVIGSVVDGAVVGTRGGCLVDKALASKVDAMPDGTVTVSIADNVLTLSSGRRKLTCQALSEAESTAPPDVEGEMVDVDPAAVLRAIEVALPAVYALPDPRPGLDSVKLSFEDGAVVSRATDGHRAHKATVASELGLPTVLLPRVCAMALRGACDQSERLRFALRAPWLHVEAGGRRMSLKVSDGVQPPIDSVIDSLKLPCTFEVDAAEMVDTLKAIGKALSLDAAVALTASGGALKLEAKADGQTAADQIDVAVTGKGCAGFAIGLLVEAFSVGDGTATVKLGKDLDPIVVNVAGAMAVVMPRRM